MGFVGALLLSLSVQALAAQPSSDQKYLIFNDRADAKAYFKKQNMPSKEVVNVLDLDSPSYKIVEEKLAEIFNVVKVSKSELKDLPPPQFLILQEALSSFVLGYPQQKLRPYIILVSAQRLKNLNYLYFTLAHELAHLVVQEKRSIRVYYRGNLNGDEPNPDSSAEEVWNKWYNEVRFGGLNHLPELASLPIVNVVDSEFPVLPSVFYNALEKFGDKNRGGCKESIFLYQQIQFRLFEWGGEGSAILTRDEKFWLDEKSSQLYMEAKKCLANQSIPKAWIIREAVENSISIRFKSDDDYRNAIASDSDLGELVEYFESKMQVDKYPDFLENIQRLTRSVNDKRIFIERYNSFDSVRLYSAEDFADTVAVRVLTQLGMNISDVFPLFANEKEKSACLEKIKKGKVPYGSPVSEHHDTCWRFERALKLETQLQGH